MKHGIRVSIATILALVSVSELASALHPWACAGVHPVAGNSTYIKPWIEWLGRDPGFWSGNWMNGNVKTWENLSRLNQAVIDSCRVSPWKELRDSGRMLYNIFAYPSSQGGIVSVRLLNSDTVITRRCNVLPVDLGDMTWNYDSMAAGKFNAYYAQIAQNLVDSGFGKITLSVFHEAYGQWNWWSLQYVKPETFRAAWRQMVDAMRSVPGAQFRFTLVWSPYATWGYDNVKVEDYYPGDDYLDVIGLDIYDRGCPENGYALNEEQWAALPQEDKEYRWNLTWDDMLSNKTYSLNWFADFTRTHNKKIGVMEWGLTSNDGEGGGYDNPLFIDSMHIYMLRNKDILDFHTYFMHNKWYGAACTTGVDRCTDTACTEQRRMLIGLGPYQQPDCPAHPNATERYYQLYKADADTTYVPPSATIPSAQPAARGSLQPVYANNRIRFSLPGFSGNGTVRLCDMRGKTVAYSRLTGDGAACLSTANLGAGTYIVNIQSPAGTQAAKIHVAR